MTVDSSPTVHFPAAKIIPTLSPKLSFTWIGAVGDGSPEALADGAAIGTSARLNKSCATGCEGTRRAIVSSPALHSSDIPELDFNGRIKLIGPGQNRSARIMAASLNSAISCAVSKSGM